MLDRRTLRIRWWHLLPAFALAVVIGLSAGSALAGRLSGTPTGVGKTDIKPVPPLNDAFMELVPEAGGPPNGGTVNVGARWAFGLMLHAASHTDSTAQQSYFTFTHELVKVASTTDITTTCTLTISVTPDISTFDTPLQNEVCNGPQPCIFRGLSIPPGSFAYASGALSTCPTGCGGTFRVARFGMCALATGQARLHWEFSPPAPITRDTEIVDINSKIISNPALYNDYVINIVGSTSTPTRTGTVAANTNTPTRTRTNTNTPVGATHTPTRTPTSQGQGTPTITGTPSQCSVCNLMVHHVDVTCNADGTVHWAALVQNRGNCTIAGQRWKATLQVSRSGHGHGRFTTVQVMHGEDDFPHGETEVGDDFCYVFSADTEAIRVVLDIQRGGGSGEDASRGPAQLDPPCNLQGISPGVEPCERQGSCHGSFSDVTPDTFFYNEIMGLASMEIVSGYEDGTFQPDNPISRGELVKVVVLAFNVPMDNSNKQNFSDVPRTHPFYRYIEAVYAQGLISGYADGTFRPDDPISRGQLAKIIAVASGYVINGPDTPNFKDVPANSTFYAYIETAHAHGLMNGYSDHTFHPGNQTSRGQVSRVVYDLLTGPE